jgi:phosphatidylinositol 4-kinase
MSNMYSLLNYIAATSKDLYDVNSTHIHPSNHYIRNNAHSLESGLRGLSEDEKRSIGISTISVVTRLALEFKVEEVSSIVVRGRIIINL